MRSIFKFIFGIIEAVIITAVVFGVTLVIGHAVTGSWNIREWKNAEPSAVVSEYITD